MSLANAPPLALAPDLAEAVARIMGAPTIGSELAGAETVSIGTSSP